MDIQVTAHGFAELSLRCKLAGRRDLDAELSKGIRAAIRPLGPAIRSSAAASMPSGYGRTLAGALSSRVAARATGSSSTVTLTTTARGRPRLRHIGPSNTGVLRHPLFGDRTRWYVTRVTSGWWSRPVDDGKGKAIDGARQAMQRVAAKIARG